MGASHPLAALVVLIDRLEELAGLGLLAGWKQVARHAQARDVHQQLGYTPGVGGQQLEDRT